MTVHVTTTAGRGCPRNREGVIAEISQTREWRKTNQADLISTEKKQFRAGS